MEGTLGTVQLFAGNFAPRSWTFCDGQLLQIAQNTALFALLGTIYGGDGRTTFGLPDLRGRVVVGAGNGPGLSSRTLGSRAGQTDVAITAATMPAHSHSASSTLGFQAQTGNGNQTSPDGNALATMRVQNNSLPAYTTQAADTDLEGAEITGTLDLANAGGNSSHENRQPFLGMNYIICLAGTFPSRN